jgi:ABC-type phosphate transport system substrate-binding protein
MRARLQFLAFVLPLLIAAIVAPARADSRPPPPPYVVIVHASNPNTGMPRRFVADAFLKKRTRWTDGSVIRPVDLPADSSTRAHFSDDVLNRSVAAVKSYWQQMIFSGRDVPPPELAKDDEVVKYVAQNEGAIGYVSGTAQLSGVKPLRVE